MTREEICELVENLDATTKFELLDSAPPESGYRALSFRNKPIGFVRASDLPSGELAIWARLAEQRISEQYCLRVLADVSMRLATAGTRSRICYEVAEGLKVLIDRADSMAIYMPAEDGVFRVAHSRGLDAVAAIPHLAGEGHVGYCAEGGQVLLVRDYLAQHESLPPLDWRGHSTPPRSILTVPIRGPAKLSDAVIQLYSAAPEQFSYADIAPIRSLGSLAVANDRRIHPQGMDTGMRWDLLKTAPEGGKELTDQRHELYRQVCKEALAQFGAAGKFRVLRSAVRIYDPGRGELRFLAWAGDGWEPEHTSRVYKIDEKSTAVRSLSLGREVLIRDTRTAEHYFQLFNDVSGIVALPIRVRSDFVAILSIDASSRDAFDGPVINALRNLASTAEAILEHFALVEDTWLHELEKSREQVTKSVKDLDRGSPEAIAKRACEEAVEGAKKLFGARACSIFLKESAADRIKLVASTALEGKPGEEVSYELGQGLTGWVAKERRSLRVRDTANPRELEEFYPGARWDNKHPETIPYADAQERGAQTFLAVPLLAQDDLLGVVRLTIKEEERHATAPSFRYSDEKLAERFASHLALFLQTLNYERDRIRLADFGRRLLKEGELPALCGLVVDEFCSLTGCEDGHIRLWDDTGEVLRLQDPVHGLPGAQLHNKRGLGEGLAGRAAQQRTPLYVSEVAGVDTHQGSATVVASKLRVVSAAAIPLIVQKDLVGTVTLASLKPVQFERATTSLLEEMAALAAYALRDAKRKSGLETEVRALQEVFAKIPTVEREFLRSRNLDQLLGTLLMGALEVSGIEAGVIRQLISGRWIVKAAYDKSSDGTDLTSRIANKEIPFHEDDLFGQIYRSRELRTMTYEDEGFQAFLSTVPEGEHKNLLLSARSIVAVPICFLNRCLGILFLLSKEAYRLGALTAGYLDILANFTAMAIEDSRHAEDDHFVAAGLIMEGFAHRARNVLHRIGMEAAVAREPGCARKRVQEALDVIAAASFGKGALTEDLEEATKGLSDQWDLREIVEEAATYRPTGTEKVELALELPAQSVPVKANKAQVRIALERVIENAFRAAGRGDGSVLVTVESSPTEATVRIDDNGPGIPPELAGKVFRPFVSGDAKGTGLGLTIARQLIRRNNGDITFEATRRWPNGTAFFLRLPIHKTEG